MEVLAIGNSFSEDAMRYIHRIAKSDGENINTVNLYIPGCSLFTHYHNMLNDKIAYDFQFNGESTGVYVSIKQVLQSKEWDYITFQQVSSMAPDYNTYQPYLSALSEYCRKYSPKSIQLMHQTWAYEENSERLTAELGFRHHEDMFFGIEHSYAEAAKALGGIGIIPCGAVFEKMIQNGIKRVHRDTFHAERGIGRYALGLAWYGYLTGEDVLKNKFNDLDAAFSEDELNTVRKSVKQILEASD